MNTTVTPRELTAEERQFLIDTLFRERCSCVIRSGDVIRIFRERGVKDLFRLLKEEPAMLRGAFIADKVVGKAAAALMVLGGVRELFADVISHPALATGSGSATRSPSITSSTAPAPAGARWRSAAGSARRPTNVWNRSRTS